MTKEISVSEFIDKLNYQYHTSLSNAIDGIGEEIIEKEVSVADSLALLKDHNTEELLGEEISYSICSATFDVVEEFVGKHLDDMGVIDYDEWCATGESESEGFIEFDDEENECYVTGRIKSYCRIYPAFSEKELRDPVFMKDELIFLVATAANDLISRQRLSI